MGAFVKGDVVVIAFPFSDLTQTKRRPALVLAAHGKDIILCQITTRPGKDRSVIPISDHDFEHGSLARDSHARPAKLFTAHHGVVLYRAATFGMLPRFASWIRSRRSSIDPVESYLASCPPSSASSSTRCGPP